MSHANRKFGMTVTNKFRNMYSGRCPRAGWAVRWAWTWSPTSIVPTIAFTANWGAPHIKTIERRTFAPPRAVLAELRRKLERCRPDYITLSGSGEPTLYRSLGRLIGGIKQITKIPVAVLTNGSLLWQPDVREDLLSARFGGAVAGCRR